MLRKKFIVVFACLLGLSSCIRDIEESINKIENVNQVQWDPTFAAPLVKTRLTVNDFLKETSSAFIEVDENNLIHVVYQGDLVSLRAKDFVSIPTQHFTGDFGLLPFHITELNNNGTTTVDFSAVFDFGIASVEIDSLIMQACAISSELSSELQHDVTVEVSLPEITLNTGQPLKLTYNLPYGGGGTVTSSQIKDLKSAFFDLTKSGDQIHSQVKANFKVTVTKVGNNPISPTDKISFTTDFLYNEYEVLYGYVGDNDISPPTADTVNFDLFRGVDSNLNNIQFRITDPKIKFRIFNSYGIPIKAQLNEFSTYSKSKGLITATGYPDPLAIPTPTEQEIGEIKIDSFELNKTNSNITDLVSNIPKWMVYNFAAQVNPPGTTERNFITYNSQLRIQADIDIPLAGSAEGFVLNKEVDISGFDDDLEDVEELEEITLRLFLENDFPVDVDLQLYFQDSMGNTLDSLIEPSQLILKSAVVDGTGKSVAPNTYTLDFVVSRDRFERMREATKGLVTARLNTYKPSSGPQPEVRFYSDYGLTVKLGIQAHAKFNFKTEGQ